MATLSAARSIFRSTSAPRATAAKFFSAAKSSAPRSTNLLSSRRIFRCPVELSACLETMQPYHTATALALMTSRLSIARFGDIWLIDDF